MFDKLHFASWIDVFQLFNRAKGFFGGFLGGHPSDEEKPETSVKGDDNLPQGIISEKFTSVDNSHWMAIRSLLSPEVNTFLDSLVKEFKKRDRRDGGNRVGTFRINLLGSPNRVETEIITRGGGQQQKGGQGTSQGQAKETVTKRRDDRFTDNDSRIRYLIGLADRNTNGESLKVIVDSLENDETVATGEFLQRVKSAAEKVAKELDNTSNEASLRFALGDEYDHVVAVGKSRGDSEKEIYENLLARARARLPQNEAEKRQRIENARRSAISSGERLARWIAFGAIFSIAVIASIIGEIT